MKNLSDIVEKFVIESMQLQFLIQSQINGTSLLRTGPARVETPVIFYLTFKACLQI